MSAADTSLSELVGEQKFKAFYASKKHLNLSYSKNPGEKSSIDDPFVSLLYKSLVLHFEWQKTLINK